MEVGNAPGGALQAVKRLEQNGKRCKAIYQVRRVLNMKNNIVIMNFSGVYEVQGLKAVLEAGKNK